MPLQLDAAHPEADIWDEGRGGPRSGKVYIFARGHMALCSVPGQFVVPLDPPPSTGPAWTPGHLKAKNTKI